MYILLTLLMVLLPVCVVCILWVSYRERCSCNYVTAFANANTRKLDADERDAVVSYLSMLVQHDGILQHNGLTLSAHSNVVYSLNQAITRYGMTTDESDRWRYYLNSKEVHLPPFWRQYIADNNEIELIATKTLPLVISLNGHTLPEYIGELRSVLTENSTVSRDIVQKQDKEQAELLGTRQETAAEQSLNRSSGWLEALMISFAFFLFFLSLNVPDMLVIWLVSGATLLFLGGLVPIFFTVHKQPRQEIHRLRGVPKRWRLFGESDQEQINAISVGTMDLIYPAHWQPFINHELGQEAEIDIYPDRRVVRQGRYLSLHDEVKNFPVQYWLRSSILSVSAFLVLVSMIIWVPLELPIMLTFSLLKGAQTVQASNVDQLEQTMLHVGDMLNIKGTGMCSIHPGAWISHQNSPYTPFDCSQIIWNRMQTTSLPDSDIVQKAAALVAEVNRQLHPKNENMSGINPQLVLAIEQSGMVLLSDFASIVVKTQALCTDNNECTRLKNALVNLSNSRDWDTLTYLARSHQLNDIHVLLRPVSARELDNLVNASTAPFFMRETSRTTQVLNSRASGGFVIINEEGDALVNQPFPVMSIYDYPAQEQWNKFQQLAQILLQTPFVAEGVVTSIRTDSNHTRYIMLHSIPDSTSIARYIGVTVLLFSLVFCTIYHAVMTIRRRQRSRNRLTKIQQYYEQHLNLRMTDSAHVKSLYLK